METKNKGKAIEVSRNENLPWVEKYRPSTLEDLYGQDEIKSTIRKFLSVKKLPHMLFYGPPGTGKTSAVLAIAREIYGKNIMGSVLELNASDDRGIDVVRDQIKSFASTRQMFNKGFKLIILDEADAMTQAAQGALRRIMEKYTSNCRFCLLANYSHKIIPAILSRCTRFRFAPIGNEGVEKNIRKVISEENIKISEDGVKALLTLSKGDMRKTLNVLQASFASCDVDETINENDIYECVGAPQPKDVKNILSTILNEKCEKSIDLILKIKTIKGLALEDVLKSITDELEMFDLKPQTKVYIMDVLSDIEYRLSIGGSEKLQTIAMIGAIKLGIELE